MDEAGVLPYFTGTTVTDAWSSYLGYGTAGALYNAHILRDLDGIHHDEGAGVDRRTVDDDALADRHQVRAGVPFVPVTWIAGIRRCGLSSRSMTAEMCSRVGSGRISGRRRRRVCSTSPSRRVTRSSPRASEWCGAEADGLVVPSRPVGCR